MIKFENLRNTHPNTFADLVGFIPEFLSEHDPRPAKEQLDENYRHGGGWNSFRGFAFDKDKLTLTYRGDAPYRAIARAKLRDETILVFQHAWVGIISPTGEIEVARMD